jgi:hypothetical protein
MRNIKFYIIIIALLALGCFLGAKLYHTDKKVKLYETEKAKQKTEILIGAKEIQRKVDSSGLETVMFDITKNALAPITPSTNTRGIIDTTAMALDIRTKQLKQVLVVKSSLEAENVKLKKQLDAAKRPYYTYSGDGLDLTFTPPNDIDTFARADFKANINIKATQYWKRSWFLGAKKSILAVSSDNPRFKINSADYVEFEQKQPTFGLRIQANTSYSFDSGELGFGPAVRFDAGRFSFQGRYSKFPNDPKWKPSVNASYDILRF